MVRRRIALGAAATSSLSWASLLALFAATGIMMMQGIMGKELIATGDQGKFRLALEFDKSTALKENNLRALEVETLPVGAAR